MSLTKGTNNGTLKLTVGATTTDNIEVTGLKAAAYKAVDTSITDGTVNLVTSKAVKDYVNAQVAGAVQYLGSVESEDIL